MNLFADLIEKDPESAWKNAGKKDIDHIGEARKSVVVWCEKALADFKAGEMEPKRGAYKIKADKALVTIRHGRLILPLDGNNRNVVSIDKLEQFFQIVIKATEEGRLDNLLTGDASANAEAEAVEKKVRKRAELSPEAAAARSEKMKAAWAKRRAAKAAPAS